MRLIRIVACAAALAACVAPGARADEWNKLTYLTFSGPVQIPGATLPAGTYSFKLLDSPTDRHIVQVFDKDQKKIYATILSIPDQRLKPTGKPVVLFEESPSGTPNAVKAWFYPGDVTGSEFVYPKSQAVKIAKATHQSVLATEEDANSAESMRSAKIGRVDENGTMADNDNDSHAAGNEAARTGNAGGTATAGTLTAAGSGVATNTPNTNVVMNPDQPASGGTSVSNAPATGSTARTATGSTARSTGSTATGSAATGSTAANNSNVNTPRHTGSTAAVGTSGQANDNQSDKTGSTRTERHARRALPRTASPLPMLELLSALAIAGGLGSRQLRKRLAARA